VTLSLGIADLTVERGGRRVIEALSFTVPAGTALLVTGPNGAGKTTLVRAIAGFIRPLAGTVRLSDPDAPLADADDEPPLAERCHYVGHANGVKPPLTVAENLAFHARYLGHGSAPARAFADPAEVVAAALDRLGLAALAAIPAGLLSAGQKRRLGLARLLVAARPLWLLDEPTVSLDAASTRLLATLIEAHLADGGIAVAVTHTPLGLADVRTLAIGGPSPPEHPAP
jgi:heme exporter protein A